MLPLVGYGKWSNAKLTRVIERNKNGCTQTAIGMEYETHVTAISRGTGRISWRCSRLECTPRGSPLVELTHAYFFNLENAVEWVNPPDSQIFSIFICLSWPPIWCPENRSCGPAARRTCAMEWLTPFRASCNAARRRRVADAVFRFNLENAVELLNPPNRLLLSIFSCLSRPPIWCTENRSCGPAARRTMRWNGSRHFELRATPQMGCRCGFQVQSFS